jgi:tyrosine-protein phosphatase YwqE
MSLFSRLLGKEPKADPIADYAWLGTDMHSHLIPGIDDGAKTIEDSVNLARQFEHLGYKKVITTPHVMTDFYRNSPETIQKGLAQVKSAIAEAGIKLEMEAACEYYLDEGLDLKLKAGPLMTFGDNYVLFEVSYINRPQGMETMIFHLNTAGYKPILAHPERYTFLYDKFEKFAEVRDLGVLFQLNLLSLAGHYGPPAREMARKLIDADMVDLVGSDVHSERHIRGMEGLLGDNYVQKLKQKAEAGRLLNTSL